MYFFNENHIIVNIKQFPKPVIYSSSFETQTQTAEFLSEVNKQMGKHDVQIGSKNQKGKPISGGRTEKWI